MTKSSWDCGLIKLYVLSWALRFRNANRDLFERGDYAPLEVVGPKHRNVCAFARAYKSKAAVIIVPRFVYSLLNGRLELPLGSDTWQETYVRLPRPYGSFRNIFTGEDLPNQKGGSVLVGQSLGTFPLALLSQG
jgi:(1->4)-alpha-D-glucan 1-alpha-D-glucosylmutase